MNPVRTTARAAGTVLTAAALAGCGASTPTMPTISVAAGEAAATVDPTLYCVDGHAQFGDETSGGAALQVKPDTTIVIDVPEAVAEVGWTVQVWSVNDAPGGTVPLAQIGNVDAGTARSFDGFTTSDAVPDRYFVIVALPEGTRPRMIVAGHGVALPEDPGCDAEGSAGIWTVLVSRVG